MKEKQWLEKYELDIYDRFKDKLKQEMIKQMEEDKKAIFEKVEFKIQDLQVIMILSFGELNDYFLNIYEKVV